MAPAVMNSVIELKKHDLETLLCQYVGSDIKVQNFVSKPLTQPGDNFGSTILDVEVTYQQENKSTHKLFLVAKLVPESPFLRQMFNIDITFRKEVFTYMLVSPEFKRLQEEKQIPKDKTLNVFPEFYGAHINEQGDINSKADDCAVLLLENLKITEYETRDRREGLDLNHMKFVIIRLAHFHALSIALKLIKPQVYQDTVLKACEKFNLGLAEDDKDHDNFVKAILGFIKTVPECVPHLMKIQNVFHEERKNKLSNSFPTPSEPFATMVHNDFWVNNMMFRYDTSDNNNQIANTKSPTDVKFVDFQILLYDSPVRDLLFFLFTSSEDGVIDKYFDNLIQLYHAEFIFFLERLGCNTDAFTYEHFDKELNTYAPKEFTHILFMLNIVCSGKESERDTTNFEQNSLLENSGGEVYARKVKNLVLTYVDKGWL